MVRAEGERDRRYTGPQVVHIQSYEAMGRSLAGDLTAAPELREELSTLLHANLAGRERVYEGTLKHYFFESGRDFPSLVQSPFVRAYEGTKLCTEDEANFLAALKDLAATTPTPP